MGEAREVGDAGEAALSRPRASGAAGPRERIGRVAWALIAVQLALLLHCAWRVGPTYDEHYYVASGYAYWRTGDFSLNREHPPLLKLLAGAPLYLFGDVEFPEHWKDLPAFPATFFYQRNAEHLDRNLFAARVPFCLLTALGSLLVFRTAARLFGPRAGLVALVLFAFNPNVLAHGSLAALDLGLAVLLFLAVKLFVALHSGPSWARALAAALAFGAANLAKFTSVLLVPVFAVLALVQSVRQRSLRPLAWTAAVFLGGLGLFFAGYGFEAKSVWQAWGDPQYRAEHASGSIGDEQQARTRFLVAVGEPFAEPTEAAVLGAIDRAIAARHLDAFAELRGAGERERKRAFEALCAVDFAEPAAAEAQRRALSALAGVELPDAEAARRFWARERSESWDRALLTQPWIERISRGWLGDRAPIPLLTALKGLDYQAEHAAQGHPSYFRGRILTPGEDFRRGNPHPEYYAVVMAVKNPLAFLLLLLVGLALVGMRAREWTLLRALALVLTPLVLFAVFSRSNALLGVKYVLPVFPFACVLASRAAEKWPRASLLLALAAVAESAWIHPHELMYYNAAAGGPVGGPAITVVGDDWGQDVRALGRFARRHAAEIEAAGGLTYAPYSVADPAAFGLERARAPRGPVRGIVAVNAVDYYRAAGDYAWLRPFQPFLRVGWSIYVYDTRAGPPGGDPLPSWTEGD